jgi:hypothetical protein
MNTMIMLCMSLSAPLVALGLHDLQARLEQWDYNRHAED